MESGHSHEWVRAPNFTDLKAKVREVGFAIVSGHNPLGHGHLAIIYWDETADELVMAEASPIPISRRTLTSWWASPKFDEFAFWYDIGSPKKRRRLGQYRPSLIEQFFPVETSQISLAFAGMSTEKIAIPHPLIRALVAAEDRRFFRHTGFDPIGICRATFMFVAHRRVQGASTVEQQLVRTITDDRRRLFRRKLKEIILASWCAARFGKSDIASLYLWIAYYGWRMNGLKQALVRLGKELEEITSWDAAYLAACIRFPLAKHEPEPNAESRLRRSEKILRSMENGHPDDSPR